MPDPTFFPLMKEKMPIAYCIEISNGFTKPNWIMFDMFCFKPARAFVFVWTGLPIKGFCFYDKTFFHMSWCVLGHETSRQSCWNL